MTKHQNKQTIPHGEKTIKVVIHHFTPDEENNKKIIWDSGFVRIASNRSRGIRNQKEIFFKNLDEIGQKVKQALKEAGVIVIKETGDKRKEIVEY